VAVFQFHGSKVCTTDLKADTRFIILGVPGGNTTDPSGGDAEVAGCFFLDQGSAPEAVPAKQRHRVTGVIPKLQYADGGVVSAAWIGSRGRDGGCPTLPR
jgi:hypothetical protein